MFIWMGIWGGRRGTWRANIDVRYTDKLQFSGTAAMAGAHRAFISRLSAATSGRCKTHRNCIHSISATHRRSVHVQRYFLICAVVNVDSEPRHHFSVAVAVSWLKLNVCSLVRTHTRQKSRIQCLRFVENIDICFSSSSRRPKY